MLFTEVINVPLWIHSETNCNILLVCRMEKKKKKDFSISTAEAKEKNIHSTRPGVVISCSIGK